MVRQDIISGLKNAMERGYSIAQAKMSLINAGYSIQDVDVAANYLVSGMGLNLQQVQYQQPQKLPQQQIQQLPQQPQKQIQPQQPMQQLQRAQQLPPQQPQQFQSSFQQLPTFQTSQQQYPQHKRSSSLGTIILSIVLILLLALLGTSLFFKDNIIEFLQTSFS